MSHHYQGYELLFSARWKIILLKLNFRFEKQKKKNRENVVTQNCSGNHDEKITLAVMLERYQVGQFATIKLGFFLFPLSPAGSLVLIFICGPCG